MNKFRENLLSFFVGLATIVGIIMAVIAFIYVTYNYTWIVLCIFITWISWLLGRTIRCERRDR